MIAFPPIATLSAGAMAELRRIGDHLRATSRADAVACAYGVGHDVCAWYDDSEGRHFDLASLTKPLFTAPTVLGLLADHDALEEPVGRSLAWLARSPRSPAVRQLLTHTAGLPPHLPAEGDASNLRGWLAGRMRGVPPSNDTVTYSDAGYWLLGDLASSLAGEPLHALFAKAPTASSGGFLFGRAPAGRSVPAGPVEGSERLPHDPAARRLGPSGHAGAFGTLAGVVHAVVTWLDPVWLADHVAAKALTCQTHPTPGGHRSLAWTLVGDPFHTVAHDWPSTTLCHTGFTGVSVALDPVSRWWAVYLSNAIPSNDHAGPAVRARADFHAAVARDLRAVGPDTIPERRGKDAYARR